MRDPARTGDALIGLTEVTLFIQLPNQAFLLLATTTHRDRTNINITPSGAPSGETIYISKPLDIDKLRWSMYEQYYWRSFCSWFQNFVVFLKGTSPEVDIFLFKGLGCVTVHWFGKAQSLDGETKISLQYLSAQPQQIVLNFAISHWKEHIDRDYPSETTFLSHTALQNHAIRYWRESSARIWVVILGSSWKLFRSFVRLHAWHRVASFSTSSGHWHIQAKQETKLQ